jgi:membrane peptidoglycan carboxypeptidase
MKSYLPNLYQLKRESSTFSLYTFAIALFTIFVIAGTFVSFFSFGGNWYASQWDQSLSPDVLAQLPSNQSTRILAADGSLLYEMYDKENREEIDLMEDINNQVDSKPVAELGGKNYIPLVMQHAMLALEDENFYTNENGLPIRNIIGAGVDCLVSSGSNCRGASGIYQQLIKNKTNDDSKSMDRKIQEIISAYRLGESGLFTHQEVLKMYLNTVGFGRNAHGVQKAAKTYFGKDIKDVTVAEACQLASFPQIPPDNNTPLQDPNAPDTKYYNDRKNTCLDYLSEKIIESKPNVALKDQKTFITTEQSELYKKEVFKFVDTKKEKRFPHFVDYVIQEIAYKKLTSKGDDIFRIEGVNERELLANPNAPIEQRRVLNQIGDGIYAATIRELQRGGYVIRTSINPKAQETLERNLAKTPLANFGGNNYGGVVLDGSSGNIVAMVGSRDYNNANIGGQTNQIALQNPYYSTAGNAWHTVGSTFKIYDYTAAFLAGANPSTPVANNCMKFGKRQNILENYSKGFCSGTYSMRESLQQSYNIAAAKALYIAGNGLRPKPNYTSADQDENGNASVRDVAEKMGVSFQVKKNKATTYNEDGSTKEQGFDSVLGSVAAIGGDEVNFLSHATGVNTIAQSGNLRTATPFVAIEYKGVGDLELRDLYKERMADGSSSPYPQKDSVIDKGVANQVTDVLTTARQRSLFTWKVDGHDVAGKSGTATRSFGGNEMTSDFTIVSFTKKYTSVLWAGRTTADGGQGIANLDSTSNLGVTAMRPLMQELHAGVAETRFSQDGLQDHKGQKLTPKQIEKYNEAAQVF